MTRRAAKVDANQRQIVRGVREFGGSVQHLHMVGDGCGDILIGYKRVNYLVEIKTETGTLTPAEEVFHEKWGGQIDIARNLDEVLELIGVEVWK